MTGFRELVDRYTQLLKSGRNQHEALDETFRDQPDDAPYDQPRYRCGVCRDSGIVEVWHFLSMKAYKKDPTLLDDTYYRRIMVIPCKCNAGDCRMWRGQGNPPNGWHGWTDERMRYDSLRFWPVENGDISSEVAINAFRAFCAQIYGRQGNELLAQYTRELDQ